MSRYTLEELILIDHVEKAMEQFCPNCGKPGVCVYVHICDPPRGESRAFKHCGCFYTDLEKLPSGTTVKYHVEYDCKCFY